MSLKDKASKVNFSGLPLVGATGDGEGASRPKTAPGAMMAFAHDQRSDLLRQNEVLQEQAARAGELQTRLDESLADLKQWEGAKATREIDPSDIQPSRFANRHASSFATAEFEALKAELKEAGGNVQPVKVRQISAEGREGKYELVYGHRRWEACRQLGLPVLAVVDNIDDRELFAEMDRENRARKDLSPWEQGSMYRRALDEGLYSSNRKLAEALGVDLGAVGRALVLADLPAEVVDAFPSPLALQFRWAKLLNDAIKADAEGVKARAKELSGRTPRPHAKEALEHLIHVKGRGVEPFNPQPVVYLIRGKKATLTLTKEGGSSVVFEPGALTTAQQKELVKLLETFARPEGKVSAN
jgi:ParB family chromosome partitioning protein